MRTSLMTLAVAATLGTSLAVAAPAQAHDGHVDPDRFGAATGFDSPQQSDNMTHLTENPGQLGISGCFMKTAPIFVTSGVNTVEVWDVSDPAAPTLTGTLPNALFENEAMNCGERRTKDGIRRFALIGVDAVQASPDDPQHVNAGGNELIVVDVTDPASPTIAARVPDVTTSTHTVACVNQIDCTFAYTAGDTGDTDRDGHFSIFDLRDLDKPFEVDSDKSTEDVDPFWSPTAGHKWNFDAAGIGTHTGWNGASMWSTERPAHPQLITTTGKAGRGDDPDFPGWNDFILHNSFRPHAKRFEPNTAPSVRNGNVLLVTEEDYEQTDCSKAGSFQTWWVKRLDGTKGAIVPLDKVELSDLGTYPAPQGAFCSAHWFDFRPGGLVAAGFYGGGTQILDVRDAKHIKSYGHSVWGTSEVWDAMWVPVYAEDGRQTRRWTNIVYSIDLARGLDVYRVTLPPKKGEVPATPAADAGSLSRSAVPLGMVGGAVAFSAAIGRLRRRRS